MRQQLHATTEPQHEQTLLCAPANVALLAEYATAQIEMPPEQQEQSEAVEKLLAILERGIQRQQKWDRCIAGVFLGGVILMLAATPIVWMLTHDLRGLVGWFSSLKFFYFVQMLGYVIGTFFLNKKAVFELTKLEDVRCVGGLVDVWSSQAAVSSISKTRNQARTALIRLLPQMKASDAPLLKEAQRNVLRGVLSRAGSANTLKDIEVEFTVAILKAFEQVGDWKSAGYVKTLISPANNKRVRAAALECLPYLQALAEKQQVGENLLRASSASEAASVAPDTLLRPVNGTYTARPEILLRASGE